MASLTIHARNHEKNALNCCFLQLPSLGFQLCWSCKTNAGTFLHLITFLVLGRLFFEIYFNPFPICNHFIKRLPYFLKQYLGKLIFWHLQMGKLFEGFHWFWPYFGNHSIKAKFAQEGIFFVLKLFVWWVFSMKKLKIEKTKPTFIVKTFKVVY